VSIFLTRSLAPAEMRDHGSLEKSTCPRRMALKMPCSDSDYDMKLSVTCQSIGQGMQEQIITRRRRKKKKRDYSPAQNGGTPQSRM
jgi:hypothetical protein